VSAANGELALTSSKPPNAFERLEQTFLSVWWLLEQ